jgi:probable HAF family extracellular repeat protein
MRLGTLGGAYTAGSSAIAINERGQVVGSSNSATIFYGQLGAGVHAFLWENGKMRDLGTLGRNPPTSAAVAISDRGEIIGNSPVTGDWRPFLWRNGKMTGLGSLGGGHSEAVAINERGQVIGGSIPAPVPVERDYRMGGSGYTHAVLWQDGKIIDLGTLDGPDIAAVDRFIDRTASDARAVNERGQVVGSSMTASGRGHAVLWTLKRG